ncbi:MAG: right-handed parallel beta-helix repeat-containing protein [Acidobacteria bacterium]|nr:right-handed parallel beta-helix repeat-containing protein [Acidobacteriota bacterium]
MRASPAVSANILVGNLSGLADPKRSSDGGAISVFEYSDPEIKHNVIVQNRALNNNDSGGIFVALWSSPLIEGNLIVGNEGGGLFLGGQEHRYGRTLDPLPPPEDFLVRVLRNLFVGNEHRGGGPAGQVSGAMRFTMQSRALLENNIIARNPGGVHLQRSELVLRNNTILDDLGIIEKMEGLAPVALVNNILRGTLTIRTGVSIAYCNVRGSYRGTGSFDVDPGFVDDGFAATAVAAKYDEASFTTGLTSSRRLRPQALAGRPIQLGESWSVVKDNGTHTLSVWGSLPGEAAMQASFGFSVPPTYRLGPGSPCIDSGTNLDAAATDCYRTPRPLHGGISKTADLGAHEHDQKREGK